MQLGNQHLSSRTITERKKRRPVWSPPQECEGMFAPTLGGERRLIINLRREPLTAPCCAHTTPTPHTHTAPWWVFRLKRVPAKPSWMERQALMPRCYHLGSQNPHACASKPSASLSSGVKGLSCRGLHPLFTLFDWPVTMSDARRCPSPGPATLSNPARML